MQGSARYEIVLSLDDELRSKLLEALQNGDCRYFKDLVKLLGTTRKEIRRYGLKVSGGDVLSIFLDGRSDDFFGVLKRLKGCFARGEVVFRVSVWDSSWDDEPEVPMSGSQVVRVRSFDEVMEVLKVVGEGDVPYYGCEVDAVDFIGKAETVKCEDGKVVHAEFMRIEKPRARCRVDVKLEAVVEGVRVDALVLVHESWAGRANWEKVFRASGWLSEELGLPFRAFVEVEGVFDEE